MNKIKFESYVNRKKHGFRIRDNRFMRRTFEPKWEEEREGWKNMHN
jgi:hypothetical protein